MFTTIHEELSHPTHKSWPYLTFFFTLFIIQVTKCCKLFTSQDSHFYDSVIIRMSSGKQLSLYQSFRDHVSTENYIPKLAKL